MLCGDYLLEVHDRGGEVGLDGNVVQASAHCSGETVLGFGSAMHAFDLPTMTNVLFARRLVPSLFFAAPRSEQRGIAFANLYRTRLGGLGKASLA